MYFGIIEMLLSLGTILAGIYLYATRSFSYWKKFGIPGPSPSFPFGNFGEVYLLRKSLLHKLQDIYEAYNDKPVVGYFVGRHPVLLVRDPELIKHVLIKDFNVFSTRGVKINEREDPLSAHLFNIDGLRWKVLRNKLTPVFTTGKLKQMFYLMLECADNFEIYLKDKIGKKKCINIREHAARYSTDVIGSCAFGVDTKALTDDNSIFRKIGRTCFDPNLFTLVKRFVREIAPRLYQFLRMGTINPEVTNFFINMMKETIELRTKEKSSRHDFVDLLMSIPKDSAADGFEWTDHLLTAQAFVFFSAGFETSSGAISFALWELARVPEIQEKLREEIIEFDQKYEGKLTYESVNDMKYLDMVVKETLRKNPAVPGLKRVATQDYRLPETNILLPAGQSVIIPVRALHHDPKYFPNPDVFDPERFTDEAKQKRHPMVFLPFGDGPKNCIGLRFGYYQVKLGLIKVLKNFRVKPTSLEPYIVDKSAVVLAALGGLNLIFESLDN